MKVYISFAKNFHIHYIPFINLLTIILAFHPRVLTDGGGIDCVLIPSLIGG